MCIHRVRSYAAILTAVLVSATGCASSDDDGNEPDNGGGSSAVTECPLDDVARARVEAIVDQAVSEAAWITNQTHGSGMGASRGFGFAVPLTTVASIVAITLFEACAEPKGYDPYCDSAEENGDRPTSCSQLECLDAGQLRAGLWFDPLPFTTALDPEPGEAEVSEARQTTTFTEQQDASIAIEWRTDFELTPEDGGAVTITEEGASVTDSPDHEPTASGSLTIEGFAAAAISVEFEASADELTGSGTFDGTELFTLDHDGMVWSGPCAEP